jgi:hypothetical protein
LGPDPIISRSDVYGVWANRSEAVRHARELQHAVILARGHTTWAVLLPYEPIEVAADPDSAIDAALTVSYLAPGVRGLLLLNGHTPIRGLVGPITERTTDTVHSAMWSCHGSRIYAMSKIPGGTP